MCQGGDALCFPTVSAESMSDIFSPYSIVKALCTVGKPWHSMLSLQVALCVRRSYATLLSERHLQSKQIEEPPLMSIFCRATTMADSKIGVHFEL